MSTFVRNNAWSNGGTFANTDLLWYAKGVGVMQSRSLDDPTSWWFFAAIHGEYVSEVGFPGWGSLPSPPRVPTTPVPTQSVQDTYWDQCQHQSWYFPPWHRGYLVALEAQVRAAVVSLQGPDDWALPYWNYFGSAQQDHIPPAFTEKQLPDGSDNPLFVDARYGPNADGNIFIPEPPASQACLSNDVYTGSSPATPRPGFGGPRTGFSHGGRVSGNLEGNPHNLVHVDVGGELPNGAYGLMADPGIAALDPIFYLHHSNIDRMWASWNAAGNANPTDPQWLGGPTTIGQRSFVMPMPDGTAWTYTPAEVNSLTQLDYTYDDLGPAVASVQPEVALTRRLTRLGAPPSDVVTNKEATVDEVDTELVGVHDGAIPITSSGARATVRLEPSARDDATARLRRASVEAPPDRFYLRLEHVRGMRDAYKLAVYVNGHDAGSVALFGLRRATLADGAHGGQGLDFELDITDIVDRIYIDGELDAESLDVRVRPDKAVQEGADITIGRVSVYRDVVGPR